MALLRLPQRGSLNIIEHAKRRMIEDMYGIQKVYLPFIFK